MILGVLHEIMGRRMSARARQPIPSIYADIVEAYPRNERVGTHTQSMGYFALSTMCRPLQQGSLSSVVRAMVL